MAFRSVTAIFGGHYVPLRPSDQEWWLRVTSDMASRCIAMASWRSCLSPSKACGTCPPYECCVNRVGGGWCDGGNDVRV